MRRIEGFIDIDRMLEKGELKKVDYKIDYIAKNMNAYIDNNNEIYFFKGLILGEPYSELLAEELLKKFELPHAEYDLAIHNKNKGVLTKNFREKNKEYISIEKIIKDYDEYLEISFGAYDNNLEKIWNALEYRYNNNPNKHEIVSKLMNQIVNLFVFDIMIGNYDRFYGNYQIEEGEDEINLAPIFDNEAIAMPLHKTSFYVDDSIDYKPTLYDELERFIKCSDSNSIEIIRNKLWIISGKNIDKALANIEKRTGYPVPDGLVFDYIKNFMEHKEKIENILSKFNTKYEDTGEMMR